MSEMARMAKLVLDHTYPVRDFLDTPLATRLRHTCPDEASYEAVRDAVLIWLREGPTEVFRLDADHEWEHVLPPTDLAALADEARSEVIRSSTAVLRGSPPVFENGRLTLEGREVARWKNQTKNRAQLAVLEEFQRLGWPDWIDNILGDERRARVACSKINGKTRSRLHFAASYDQLSWSFSRTAGEASSRVSGSADKR